MSTKKDSKPAKPAVKVVASKPKPTTVKQPGVFVEPKLIQKAIEFASIAQPYADYIYVNALGEYFLCPRPGCMKVAVGEDIDTDEEPVYAAPAKAKAEPDEDDEDELPETAPDDKLEF